MEAQISLSHPRICPNIAFGSLMQAQDVAVVIHEAVHTPAISIG